MRGVIALSPLSISIIMAGKGISTTSEPLGFEEYIRLINHLEKDKKYCWALFCILACCFALRASDVLNLRWRDVLGGDICFVKEKKTKKIRRLKINPSVSAKIHGIYKEIGTPDPNELIFLSKRTGRPYTIQNVNVQLRGFKTKYKLPIDKFSTHSFRKTFGKKVFEDSGESEKGLILLSRELSHSSPDVTRRYIGLKDSEYGAIYDSIQI